MLLGEAILPEEDEEEPACIVAKVKTLAEVLCNLQISQTNYG